MQEELRCYTFTDFMYSSIQQGIQSGHAAVELFNKYLIEEGWQNGYAEVVQDWAANYKTMVCLNGGTFADVCDWLCFFEDGFVIDRCLEIFLCRIGFDDNEIFLR